LICSTCFAPKCRCRKLWRTDLASRTTPLGYRLRSNYFYARVVVGNELSVPTIALVA
jgi:hypothetical protein